MSGIFYSLPLSKTASNGAAWARLDATFPQMTVFANVFLSEYRAQTPERFTGFQSSWAQAYIVTPETPMQTVGFGVTFPTRWDNTVFLTTDRLTFWLQAGNTSSNNPPTSASAIGNIYAYEVEPKRFIDTAKISNDLSLVVHTEDGTVVGTHRAVQFTDGPALDEEQVREAMLTEAHAVSGMARDSFRIASFSAGEVPPGDFRVDPSTGRPEPVNVRPVDQHPFRPLSSQLAELE